MPTVAIISEYNPFHNGHKYQIDELRRIFGEQTEIIAIMSGNYTQRGALAIAEKTVRAKSAVLGGVNLVLEIPFPFSASSAEFYARAGVSIANSIGVVDYLSFGSEIGDIDQLTKIADNMMSERYLKKLSDMQKADSQTGYAKLCEQAYAELYGDDDRDVLSMPNNILAIEYIKAIKSLNSKIRPHTIKRLGAGYNEENITDSTYQSASAIRNTMRESEHTAYDFVPYSTKIAYLTAKDDGLYPSSSDAVSSAVITSFLLNSHREYPNIHDTAGGLYNRLLNNARKSTNISELVRLTETKHYTTARIKRSIWFSLFGVTSSDVRALPSYSQVLAMDSVGKQILKRIKKLGDIKLLTKPSATDSLPKAAIAQKKNADTADALFGLALPKKRTAEDALKFTPFVK